MKSVFIAIFAFLGWATYANNAKVDVMETLDILNSKHTISISEERVESQILEKESQVAFEYYYTMDWLYEETPFIYKLEALV